MQYDENRRIRCAFIRGGSSNGLFFNANDLPGAPHLRDEIFLALMGSPDAYGRQLNGMGGGVSSLSKIAIIALSSHPQADIEYTFGQVSVDQSLVDYSSNCGNLSSAAAPYALDEGLLNFADGPATVRVLNTNTQKIYLCHFEVVGGKCKESGDFDIPGVTGAGAKIRLEYPDPSGAATGSLLPTGRPTDVMTVEGVGMIEVSLIDASNPVVFVEASRLGVSATEDPNTIDQDSQLMAQLESIRRQAAVLMGLAKNDFEVAIGSPKIALVGPPLEYSALSGGNIPIEAYDLAMRIISVGRAHKVVTLTGAMCAAVAARIEGSLVHKCSTPHSTFRIGTPSGPLPVDANVKRLSEGTWQVDHVTTWRTQRRLMEGYAFIPQRVMD